jgi:hypothetical protein
MNWLRMHPINNETFAENIMLVLLLVLAFMGYKF